MKTIYENKLGKCYAKRGSYRIYKEPGSGHYAVYMVAREALWTKDNDFIGFGSRYEAVMVGYVANIENAEYAFDMAEEESRALMAQM